MELFTDLQGKGHKKAWDTMERQNIKYLGEDWNTTADKLATEGEDTYLNKLPKALQEWTEKQIGEQTETFFSIQAVHTSIMALGQYLIINNIINTFHWTEAEKQNLPKYIGWAWHLLHTEQ